MENYRVIHKHSLLGNEMIPVNDELDYGEIAIDYHGGSEALYIKNDNDEIVSFTPSTDHPVFEEGSGPNSVQQKYTGAAAHGAASVAEGSNTIAENDYEHAEGVYNLSNTGSTASAQTISSVGIGTSSQRKNALEVMQNGDVYMLGVGGYDGTNAGGQDVKTVKDYFQFLINWVNLSFTPKPVVVYETDGTTGLLGLNESSFGNNNWQLEDLNLSGFSFIRCYFKASASGASQPSGAMVVDIPLDNAASVGSSYAYFGSVLQLHPFNRNRQIGMGCAVDSTKTKFKVVYQITLWDISVSDANSASDARYLYKIVGYYEY